jgi:hypothetical protein
MFILLRFETCVVHVHVCNDLIEYIKPFLIRKTKVLVPLCDNTVRMTDGDVKLALS